MGRWGLQGPHIIVLHVTVAINVSVVVVILQQWLGNILLGHVGWRGPPAPPQASSPPGVGGVGRGVGPVYRGHDLHPVVDVVSDPDVLILPPRLPSPSSALPLTEVDVQIMQSDGGVWPARPSAPPPGPAP